MSKICQIECLPKLVVLTSFPFQKNNSKKASTITETEKMSQGPSYLHWGCWRLSTWLPTKPQWHSTFVLRTSGNVLIRYEQIYPVHGYCVNASCAAMIQCCCGEDALKPAGMPWSLSARAGICRLSFGTPRDQDYQCVIKAQRFAICHIQG